MSIDLSQPAGAFTGPHIQGTDDDVSKPIVNVVNPPANPTAASIFDLLKHADRKMIFRLETKSEDGTSFLSAPEYRLYTGTYDDFKNDGFEIRLESTTWGIYHRNTAGEDSDGNAPSGYIYKTVMYAFDLEERFANFQSFAYASRQAKLQAGDFLDASDLNHEAGKQHKKSSPLTQANAFASYEIYECTSTNGATVERNTIRVDDSSADAQLKFDGTNIGDAVTANADKKAFAEDIKTELDKAASKAAIGYDTLAVKTKNILSIDAVESARASLTLQVQNEAKYPKSDITVQSASFTAAAATMDLSLPESVIPENNATGPSQTIEFKADPIGTAATARVRTVTLENKDYGTNAHRNTQILTLDNAAFQAASSTTAAPSTTLTVAQPSEVQKTISIDVDGSSVLDGKTYRAQTAEITLQNESTFGIERVDASQAMTFTQSPGNLLNEEVVVIQAAGASTTLALNDVSFYGEPQPTTFSIDGSDLARVTTDESTVFVGANGAEYATEGNLDGKKYLSVLSVTVDGTKMDDIVNLQFGGQVYYDQYHHSGPRWKIIPQMHKDSQNNQWATDPNDSKPFLAIQNAIANGSRAANAQIFHWTNENGEPRSASMDWNETFQETSGGWSTYIYTDEYNTTRYNNGIALNSTNSGNDWASAGVGEFTVISNFSTTLDSTRRSQLASAIKNSIPSSFSPAVSSNAVTFTASNFSASQDLVDKSTLTTTATVDIAIQEQLSIEVGQQPDDTGNTASVTKTFDLGPGGITTKAALGDAIVAAFGFDGAHASAFLSSVVNNNGTITFLNDFNPEHPSDPKNSKSFRLTVNDIAARDYVAEGTADADAKLEIVGIPGKDLATAAGASTDLTLKEPAAWGNPPEYSETLAISPALPTGGQYNRPMLYSNGFSNWRRFWFDSPQRQIKYEYRVENHTVRLEYFRSSMEYIHTGDHNLGLGNNVTFWVHGEGQPTNPSPNGVRHMLFPIESSMEYHQTVSSERLPKWRNHGRWTKKTNVGEDQSAHHRYAVGGKHSGSSYWHTTAGIHDELVGAFVSANGTSGSMIIGTGDYAASLNRAYQDTAPTEPHYSNNRPQYLGQSSHAYADDPGAYPYAYAGHFYETSASAGGAELTYNYNSNYGITHYYIAKATLIDHTNGDAETVFDSINHWGSGKMNAIPTEANIAASLAYAFGQIPALSQRSPDPITSSSNGATLSVNSSGDFQFGFSRTNYTITEPAATTKGGTSQPFAGTIDTTNSLSVSPSNRTASDDTITVQIAPLNNYVFSGNVGGSPPDSLSFNIDVGYVSQNSSQAALADAIVAVFQTSINNDQLYPYLSSVEKVVEEDGTVKVRFANTFDPDNQPNASDADRAFQTRYPQSFQLTVTDAPNDYIVEQTSDATAIEHNVYNHPMFTLNGSAISIDVTLQTTVAEALTKLKTAVEAVSNMNADISGNTITITENANNDLEFTDITTDAQADVTQLTSESQSVAAVAQANETLTIAIGKSGGSTVTKTFTLGQLAGGINTISALQSAIVANFVNESSVLSGVATAASSTGNVDEFSGTDIYVSAGQLSPPYYTFSDSDGKAVTQLRPNTVYTFRRSGGATSHPFAIDHATAVYSAGSTTQGITGTETITIDTANLANLSYKCTAHPLTMVGEFSIIASKVLFQSDGDFTVTITDPASSDAIAESSPLNSNSASDYSNPTDLANAIRANLPANVGGTVSGAALALVGSQGQNQSIRLKVTQSGGNADINGECDAFDAYAFPTGMEQVLYGSGSNSGKNFTYSVRMAGDASGATVDVSGAANLDAALSQIHTAFNAYKQSNPNKVSRSEIVLVEGAFAGTKKISLRKSGSTYNLSVQNAVNTETLAFFPFRPVIGNRGYSGTVHSTNADGSGTYHQDVINAIVGKGGYVALLDTNFEVTSYLQLVKGYLVEGAEDNTAKLESYDSSTNLFLTKINGARGDITVQQKVVGTKSIGGHSIEVTANDTINIVAEKAGGELVNEGVIAFYESGTENGNDFTSGYDKPSIRVYFSSANTQFISHDADTFGTNAIQAQQFSDAGSENVTIRSSHMSGDILVVVGPGSEASNAAEAVDKFIEKFNASAKAAAKLGSVTKDSANVLRFTGNTTGADAVDFELLLGNCTQANVQDYAVGTAETITLQIGNVSWGPKTIGQAPIENDNSNHFLTSQDAADDFHTYISVTADLIGNVDGVDGIAKTGRSIVVSGDALSGTAAKSFQFTKTGDESDNVTDAVSGTVSGTNATNDITYTISSSDLAAENPSDNLTLVCGHSPSANANTRALAQSYLVNNASTLAPMVASAANLGGGFDVRLTGRANGKGFDLSIGAVQSGSSITSPLTKSALSQSNDAAEIGKVLFTTASEHGIFNGDIVTTKNSQNAANNQENMTATRITDKIFSVQLSSSISTADAASLVDNKAVKSVQLRFKRDGAAIPIGTVVTVPITGSATDLATAIAAAMNAIKDDYAGVVSSDGSSVQFESIALTDATDDKSFTVQIVADDANVDALDLEGEQLISASGDLLAPHIKYDLGAGHGVLPGDIVTVAGATAGANNKVDKTVLSLNGTSIVLNEGGGVDQLGAGGTVTVHNVFVMSMLNDDDHTLSGSGADSKLQTDPADALSVIHTPANYAGGATLKDLVTERWTLAAGHTAAEGDLIRQVSEAPALVEIARGKYSAGKIEDTKGRFFKNDAFKLQKSSDNGSNWSDLSTSASTFLTLQFTEVTGASREMFRELKDGIEMTTKGTFEVGKYYVNSTDAQVLKATLTGPENDADAFKLNDANSEYNFVIEAGAMSVQSGDNAVANQMKNGSINFTTESGYYGDEALVSNVTSNVSDFVLSIVDASDSSANTANYGYYSNEDGLERNTKTLAGVIQLNNVDVDIDDENTPIKIEAQVGDKLDGSGAFVEGDLDVVMDGIDFGKATFAKKAGETGVIEMTLILDQNTFLLDNNMEFEFTLKLSTSSTDGTQSSTLFVLYKFTDFQKGYGMHSSQNFADRSTWRTLHEQDNASLANFHVVAPTLSDVENVYFQSRSQDQILDIDGLSWTYDNTAGAEAYKAEIDLTKTKSEQISAYGRIAAAIHADLKKLKAGAGDTFEVSVMADFLSKPVLGGFTKEDGDDKTFHATTVSIVDEERDPDSSKIQMLSVAYTAGDKIELALKMDDESQKILIQISDDATAQSTNRKKIFGTTDITDKITQLVSLDGVAVANERKVNATNLPAASGNFELQIDSEASAANLLGNSTQASIDGKKILNVGGTVNLSNDLTIAAGTQIIFGDNASLEGKLTCQGTAKDPIVFKHASDSIEDIGSGAKAGRWRSVILSDGSNLEGCVFLGGAGTGTVVVSGGVTMANCAIFNAQSKSIAVSGSNSIDFITVGNNANNTDIAGISNLISLSGGKFTNSGSGQDAFAAVNKEWFAVQNRLDMHLSYTAPGTYDLTKNADKGSGAFIFFRTNPIGGLNVFRMESGLVARGVSLYNVNSVTATAVADLSFAKRDALVDQHIGDLQLDSNPLTLKSGSIPAGIYVYFDYEFSQGSVRRSLDDGKILLSRTASEIPSKVQISVSNSNRGVFDVDSKDLTTAIEMEYTEDPAIEVKHHEKLVNPFRKVIKGGDYGSTINVAGMTQVVIDGAVVLKDGASLVFDANTDIVLVERERTVVQGVLSLREDELLDSIADNSGYAEGTYFDVALGDKGGKCKIVVDANGAITDIDVTAQGAGYAKDDELTIAATIKDSDDNNELGKAITITLTADDVADVYPHDLSGIVENGGTVEFKANCVVRTDSDYQLKKESSDKVLGLVCGKAGTAKRLYVNRELLSLDVELPAGAGDASFFVPCRVSCTEAAAKNLDYANRLVDAIRLPASIDDMTITDVALLEADLEIAASKTLRVEPGARLVAHKSMAEKLGDSNMAQRTLTVTGKLQCVGVDNNSPAELCNINVAGAGSFELRHAIVVLQDGDKLVLDTDDNDTFIDSMEIRGSGSGSQEGLELGANLDSRAQPLEARKIKMKGASINVKCAKLILQDCDVLGIDASKYAIECEKYGPIVRKIRINGEKLVQGGSDTLLSSLSDGSFLKAGEQGLGAAFENDLVIFNVADAAFNEHARLYAEKEAASPSLAGMTDAQKIDALAAYNAGRADFGGAAIADIAAFSAAIAMAGDDDYFLHVGQTFDKDVDQKATKTSTTVIDEQFKGHMMLKGELLDRVDLVLTAESATANVFDDDNLTRTVVVRTEKCTFEGSIADGAFTFTQKPLLLLNGGLRESGSPTAGTNAAIREDAFNAYAALSDHEFMYQLIDADGDVGAPSKNRLFVKQDALHAINLDQAIDGSANYKYDPSIVQSEYGRLDKGAFQISKSGTLKYVAICGSKGGIALTADDEHVAILHTQGNAASGTLKNVYIEDCSGHAVGGSAVIDTRLECVDYGKRLVNGTITQTGAKIYAESEALPRGAASTQFDDSVAAVQAPHQAFCNLPASASFEAVSDADRLAHWWNPLRKFSSAYKFQGLAANDSQDVVYGLLETDGSPAQLNDASATKVAASRIGASAYYELKKSNAEAGAPKAQFKTTGENSVEVSMAAELTLAEDAATSPASGNRSDADVTTQRTDRTASGDSIDLAQSQLTLADATKWGPIKQVVSATYTDSQGNESSYNDLLLPANDDVAGSVRFAATFSVPLGTYKFSRIEYAVAKDVQFGAMGSMNPAPRGSTASDNQLLTVNVLAQPKLQIRTATSANGSSDALDELDNADDSRVVILRASQLNQGDDAGPIKAVAKVEIINENNIPGVNVVDPGNAKFTASNTKIVSVAGQHTAKDTNGQLLELKLEEAAGLYDGASNSLTIKSVMEAEVKNSEFGTQALTVKSVDDVTSIDIDSAFFDTANDNTHLVCRDRWYDLPADVRSISATLNNDAGRDLAAETHCDVTATQTLESTDLNTKFIGDWTWTEDRDPLTDSVSGRFTLEEKNQKLSGVTTGDLTINKPVLIISGSVTLNGDLTLGPECKQILFQGSASLNVSGKLTIAGSDIDKPVLARHIDDHTLQFCRNEFTGITCFEADIKGFVMVGGTNQLVVSKGTVGGTTNNESVRLFNGCETALEIAGSDVVTCQNIYIRGAKEAVKSTNTNASTLLKDCRMDDCLNTCLNVDGADSKLKLGNVFLNSPSEPRGENKHTVMGSGTVAVVAGTVQYLAANTRDRGTIGAMLDTFWTIDDANTVGKDLADAASNPLVDYDQGAAADRMATLQAMGYVPTKAAISTQASLVYREEYSHYYTDPGMTSTERTVTESSQSYKVETKEYMQGLRFSANQYVATLHNNKLNIDGNGNKVFKDATLSWTNGFKQLQLFTGQSTRSDNDKTSIRKGIPPGIILPGLTNAVDEFDLEDINADSLYDFIRLQVNTTPLATNQKETKSTSYSMFTTLASYGDAPQFRILSKGAGASTDYQHTNDHNWLLAGSTVTGEGACGPMVVLTFATLPAGLEHDIPITQGSASGNVYGIDTANNKILVGEVSGTFNDSDNVSINGSDSGQAPTSVMKDNRLAKALHASMTMATDGELDFNNDTLSAPLALQYTMQNEAYLSVFDKHPFGISDKRHAEFEFGNIDADLMESHGNSFLDRAGPTFANDGEIVITQKDTIDLPDADNSKTTELMDLAYTMPNAITLGGSDIALDLNNKTNALLKVRACIRPHIHATYSSGQAEPGQGRNGYSSQIIPNTAKIVASGGADIATLNISPSIPDSKALVQGNDAVQFIDFVPSFGTAPTNYKGVALSELKDGYLLEFKRGNLSTTITLDSVSASFAKAGDVVTVTTANGLQANAFVEISGASEGNNGLFQVMSNPTMNDFRITNANGVAESNVTVTILEVQDIGLQLGLNNTTLRTRDLQTTKSVRPGLKYKASFGDAADLGSFTFTTDHFPRVQTDLTAGLVSGSYKMIDGIGNACDDNAAAFDALSTILSNHASYVGPYGGMALVEDLSVESFSNVMQKQPKLFKIPDEQLHSNQAQGKTGTLEVTGHLENGFKAKFKTDCCMYVSDTNSQYALKKANAPHADSQSINVLQKTDGSVTLKVGDTLTDGDDYGSGVVQKIVVTGTTIQIQLDTTANIDASSSGSTLKVGNTVVFTHSSNLTWTVGATYYSSSARPIPVGNMVLFAKTRAASNNFKGYGLLKAHTYANGEMDFIRTTDDPDADGFQTNQDERINCAAGDMAIGDTVVYMDTESQDKDLADKPGIATFKSGHSGVGANVQQPILNAIWGDAFVDADISSIDNTASIVAGMTVSGTNVAAGTVVTSAGPVGDVAYRINLNTPNGSPVPSGTLTFQGLENNQFKVTHADAGEHPDKLVIIGISTHGIRTNSNGVYENKKNRYFLHMRLDDRQIDASGDLFLNKVMLIETDLTNPYSLMRTTTVANNSIADLQMSNVIRGTENEVMPGYTTRPYETKELEVVSLDMSSNATIANNPAHWGADVATTRVQDLSGILIVDPNELTEHGSAFVQNTDAIHGTLQALKRPSTANTTFTGDTNAPPIITVSFSNKLPIPADGKIVVTVPSSFSGIQTSVSGGNIDGSLVASINGEIVTITRSGGSATEPGDERSVTLTLTTMGANGTSGFELYITDASNTILESDYKPRSITIA